ncbi:MAG: UbiX family flavin prenyltransferase [Chloroflexota bacterium]|nr:UbiX family flavin prenyltransferase [Chloroflexota bacterium]
MENPDRIVLAITGASGVIYGLQAIKTLKDHHVEVHLVISPVGAQVIAEETDTDLNTLLESVDYAYQPDDLSAPIASGSFHTKGMLIIPCSIKTLSGIANSYAENLVQRAADVCLKEGRPLLLAVRETPLHVGHLRLMSQAAQAGAVIYPLAPAYYTRPETIEDLVKATVGRMLARVGLENELYQPWNKKNSGSAPR